LFVVQPIGVFQDAMGIVDDFVSVHEDGYPAPARQVLDLGPFALQERDPNLVELNSLRA
jgi:hypothetical protein